MFCPREDRMDFGGDMDTCRPMDSPNIKPSSGPEMPLYINHILSGLLTVRHMMTDKCNGREVRGSLGIISDKISLGNHPKMVPEHQCTPPASTREGLENISTKRDDLYRQRPPEGKPIPILAHPEMIPEKPPGEEEITEAVRKVRRGRAGVPSGIQAKI